MKTDALFPAPGPTLTAAFGLALALALARPAAAAADPPLRAVMRVWRADARTARDMLAGHTAPDPAALRDILARYESDAGRITMTLGSGNAAARDIRARFARFATDAQGAQADLAAPARLAGDFRRLMGDCQSCHDLYK
jgi:cytochrome c556